MGPRLLGDAGEEAADLVGAIDDVERRGALAAAIGGTIDPMRVIESNMVVGNLSPAIKQVLYLGFAFLGAHMGSELVKWVCSSRS